MHSEGVTLITLLQGKDTPGTNNEGMVKGVASMKAFAKKATDKGYTVIFEDATEANMEKYIYGTIKYYFAFVYAHGGIDTGFLTNGNKELNDAYFELVKGFGNYLAQINKYSSREMAERANKGSVDYFSSQKFIDSLTTFENANIRSYLLLDTNYYINKPGRKDTGDTYILSCWNRFLFKQGTKGNIFLPTFKYATKEQVIKERKGKFNSPVHTSLKGNGNPFKIDNRLLPYILRRLAKEKLK